MDAKSWGKVHPSGIVAKSVSSENWKKYHCTATMEAWVY